MQEDHRNRNALQKQVFRMLDILYVLDELQYNCVPIFEDSKTSTPRLCDRNMFRETLCV